MICPECSTVIDESLVCGPVKCQCEVLYVFPNCKCIYRGEFRGRASCACGSVFHCSLKEKLCGDVQPPDEFADVNGTFLTSETFNCCTGCEEFDDGSKA